MKKINCYECAQEFQAETREGILNALYEHYMKEHRSIILNVTEAEKKAWMEKFEKDWAVAEEV